MCHTLRRALDTHTAYVNFPDPGLPGWQHTYYRGNYERLVTVKEHYAPFSATARASPAHRVLRADQRAWPVTQAEGTLT
ncbi:BBE domain-containing protein [Streptomyces sp. NPDC017988]|uniref:BBE domain-containing protein n=1 Tax=Streptomyces sp. NPDC017988 TaxID=3365025 RepID=UPI0037BB9A30